MYTKSNNKSNYTLDMVYFILKPQKKGHIYKCRLNVEFEVIEGCTYFLYSQSGELQKNITVSQLGLRLCNN